MTINEVAPKLGFDLTITPKLRVLKAILYSYNLLILCWASPKPETPCYEVLETLGISDARRSVKAINTVVQAYLNRSGLSKSDLSEVVLRSDRLG